MAKFKVWQVDSGYDEDSAKSFDGFDHEDAAETWAGWYDAHYADYLIVGGQDAEVFVLGQDDKSPIRVIVSGEPRPVYTASIER